MVGLLARINCWLIQHAIEGWLVVLPSGSITLLSVVMSLTCLSDVAILGGWTVRMNLNQLLLFLWFELGIIY